MSASNQSSGFVPTIGPVIHGSNQSPFLYPRPTDELVKQAKILIIDDDEPTTIIIQKYLQECGFANVETICDSQLAISKVLAFRPDLVLLDLIMPVSGAAILAQIRSGRQIANIPVLALTSAANEETRAKLLNLGANGFLGKPIVSNELFARVRNTLSAKVAYDELKQQSEKLKQDVLRDTLTQTANRRAFDFELNRKMLEWNRQQPHFSLLMLDIDHFKKINDTFGHQAGDEALRSIAHVIGRKIREIDLLCRIGGEEFAVIMPVSNRLESTRAGERIRREVRAEPA